MQRSPCTVDSDRPAFFSLMLLTLFLNLLPLSPIPSVLVRVRCQGREFGTWKCTCTYLLLTTQISHSSVNYETRFSSRIFLFFSLQAFIGPGKYLDAVVVHEPPHLLRCNVNADRTQVHRSVTSSVFYIRTIRRQGEPIRARWGKWTEGLRMKESMMILSGRWIPLVGRIK